MKRKRHCLCACALGLILFATACAEPPEDVQKEISILDRKEESSLTDSSVEAKHSYVPLSEIRDTLDSVLENNHNIVQIIGTPVLPTGDTMPCYTFSACTATDEEVKAGFHAAFSAISSPLLTPIRDKAAWYDTSEPITTLNMQDVTGKETVVDFSEKNWTTHAKGYGVMDDAGNASLALTAHGLVCNYWEDYSDPPMYRNNATIAESVMVGYGEKPEQESYPMYQGAEWRIDDAVTFAEQFYNNAFSSLPLAVTYRVKEVIAYRMEDGSYGYNFAMQAVTAENTPILALDTLDYAAGTEDLKSVLFGSVNTLWCVKPNTVNELSMAKRYTLTRTEEQPLLSAQSAIQILSDALAQKQMQSVYMELGYAYRVSGSELMQRTADPNAYDTALENGDFTTAELVPYWLFYKPFEGTKPTMSGTYYLVNALTGELEIR